MQALRALVHGHRRLAVLLVVLTLAVRAMIPAGYMPGELGTVLTVQICADATGGTHTMQVVVPNSKAAGDAETAPGDTPATCAYSALGQATLAGADGLLLALALAFVLALGLLPAPRPPLRRIAHARPPLRGPPAHA